MEVTKRLLVEMVNTRMPFGQYENTVLCNLPASYLEDFNTAGFPNGKLGMLLQALYEIRKNHADHILEPFKQKTTFS